MQQYYKFALESIFLAHRHQSIGVLHVDKILSDFVISGLPELSESLSVAAVKVCIMNVIEVNLCSDNMTSPLLEVKAWTWSNLVHLIGIKGSTISETQKNKSNQEHKWACLCAALSTAERSRPRMKGAHGSRWLMSYRENWIGSNFFFNLGSIVFLISVD